MRTLAGSLHAVAAKVGHELARYLRQESLAVIERYNALAQRTVTEATLPREVTSFADAVRRRPAAFLGDILDDVFGHQRQSWDWYRNMIRWEEQLCFLLPYGLVSVDCLGDIDLMDDQEVLARALVEPPARSGEANDEEQEKKLASLTTLLRGFKAHDREAFIAWANTLAQELGLTVISVPLPVQFLWHTNDDRLRAIADPWPPSKSHRQEDHVFIHAVVNTHDSSCGLRAAVWAFAAPILDLSTSSLFKSREDIFKRLTESSREARCQDLLSGLSRVAPVVAANLADIEARMWAGEKRIDIPDVYQEAGKLLLNYLYWKHAREVVGDAVGVTHKAIMDLYGIQGAHYRKVIDPVSLPWPCPSCGATTRIDGLSLHRDSFAKVSHVAAAKLSCQQCGHAESFDASSNHRSLETNAVVCPCPRCEVRRRAAFAVVRVAAPTLRDRLVEPLAKVEAFVDLTSMRSHGHVGKLVAALWEGYSLEQARCLLFAGTSDDDGEDVYQPTPEWAAAAVQAGILSAGVEERLCGEDARRFLWAEVLHVLKRLPPGATPEEVHFELEFQSEDQAIVVRAMSDLLELTGWVTMALPVRRRATVRWEAVDAYVAQEGLRERSKVELLTHVCGKDHEVRDIPPRHTSWWPSAPSEPTRRVEPALRSQSRAEVEAVRLLEGLGYIVKPPRH